MNGKFWFHAAGCLSTALFALVLAAPEAVAAQDEPFDMTNCRRIQDAATRLRCYAIAPVLTSSPRAIPPPPSGWKLIRTPNPQGGTDAVSIIRTADLGRSDPDLAGLMLRCAGPDFEVLVVVVRPLPPRARPGVTLQVGSRTTRFDATVVAPGAALLLPGSAAAMARGLWQGAPEATVEVDEETAPVRLRGAVSLAGLGSAIATLLASCPR
jgi:hypothetical protein